MPNVGSQVASTQSSIQNVMSKREPVSCHLLDDWTLHESASKEHTLLACSMVCNRSWYLPGTLVWHPARIIKEGGYVDLSMDTMHLKDILALIRSEGSALTLPLSLTIVMLCHCSSTITKDHFLIISFGT